MSERDFALQQSSAVVEPCVAKTRLQCSVVALVGVPKFLRKELQLVTCHKIPGYESGYSSSTGVLGGA